MANGKIKTLFSDKEKTEALFPRTKISAVSDNNGVGLDALLNNMNAEIGAKATEVFVTNKIAEAQLSGGGSGDIDLSGYATKDDVRNIDFPVDSVNGKTGAVTLSASDVGAVPTTRKVNGKDLSGDIALNYDDVGAVYRGIPGPNTSGFNNYGLILSRAGNTYGTSGGVDNYYLFIDCDNNVKAGLQLNGASTINWNKIFTEKTPPTAAQVGAAAASAVGTNKVFNKLTDIGITTFPTTMKTVVNSMPNNSTLMLDSRDIIAGSTNEISDLGIGNAGMYMFMRGNSNARVSLLHIYGATGATTSYMNYGCYAATSNTVTWIRATKTTKVKLWENAKISSAFNAQTVSVDLSDYDGVEILYYVDSTTNIYQNTGFIKKGLPGIMYYVTASAGNRLHRNFTVNTTGIKFETAEASSGASAGGLCIPYQIYGIKGVG